MTVSIHSLVYNHEKYLHTFFRGILNQQVSFEYEIVLGVDQSTDNSLSICREYQQRYPAIIKIIEHTTRVGMINNYIATYNACKGKYIAMCEGDDYWTDDQKLNKQVALLDRDEKAVLCFTDIKILDEEEGTFHPNWANISKEIYSIEDIIFSNPVSTCSVMFRNHLVELNETSLQGLPMADWPLYVELLTRGYARFLNRETAVYRRSAQSTYSKNTTLETLYKKKTAYEYLLELPVLAKYKKQLLKAYYYHLYAIGTRLDKDDKMKKVFLKKAAMSINRNNVSVPLKAFIRMLQ